MSRSLALQRGQRRRWHRRPKCVPRPPFAGWPTQRHPLAPGRVHRDQEEKQTQTPIEGLPCFPRSPWPGEANWPARGCGCDSQGVSAQLPGGRLGSAGSAVTTRRLPQCSTPPSPKQRSYQAGVPPRRGVGGRGEACQAPICPRSWLAGCLTGWPSEIPPPCDLCIGQVRSGRPPLADLMNQLYH